MLEISDEQFNTLIAEVIDELPAKYIKGLKNVLITYEDEPSPAQQKKLNLHQGETLYGLYEGIPLTKRNAGYQFVLPDKITIFKSPLQRVSSNYAQLKVRVKHTVWHEVAHYYGLDHERIASIERRWKF